MKLRVCTIDYSPLELLTFLDVSCKLCHQGISSGTCIGKLEAPGNTGEEHDDLYPTGVT